MKNHTNAELIARIQNYLGNGGLINPEAMEHEKVRDLMVDLRDHLLADDRTTVPVPPQGCSGADIAVGLGWQPIATMILDGKPVELIQCQTAARWRGAYPDPMTVSRFTHWRKYYPVTDSSTLPAPDSVKVAHDDEKAALGAGINLSQAVCSICKTVATSDLTCVNPKCANFGMTVILKARTNSTTDAAGNGSL